MFRFISVAVLAVLSLAAQTSAWRDEGIIHTAKSSHAKLHDVPIHAVTISEGFWAARRKTNVESSIPSMLELMLKDGRMENFRRLSGKSTAPQKGRVAADTDIYKWTEAAGFTLQSGARPELAEQVSAMVDDVVAAQEPGGYLDTYYQGDRIPLRMQWTTLGGGRGAQSTQETGHELYTLGHLLQASIAYYRATGNRKLLDAGIRAVDHFVLTDYGPDKKPLISGHPEIEMALVELYRITGQKRYLDLTGYLLQGDPGRISLRPDRYVYLFSGIPFTSRTKLEGHAVRAMYACSGATDYYLETGDPAYWHTLETLWKDLAGSKLYVTGGVGARSNGEAFGDPYELPNAAAYSESCAAIGNMMWNWRMLAATGEARFTDVMELALYNTINAGMSLDGKTYCYRNPLEYVPGRPIRNPWYDTLCCPPNLERTFAALPGYFYSTSPEGVYVHLYDDSALDWHLENGTGIKIAQKTDYPWDGTVEITVSPAQATVFTLYLRIPGWSRVTRVSVNGRAVSGATAGEYLAVKRRWTAGDAVRLTFDMNPRMVASHPRVEDDRGRVAVERGPLVYCIEQLDQPGVTSLTDLALTSGADEPFRAVRKELLGGVVVLEHDGVYFDQPLGGEPLYQAVDKAAAKRGHPVSVTLIPYYAWANRAPSAMQVWIALR
ncbi:MAG TPA: beta-L-arabinofuranosidase domain-containing protein [Bryobacteraceae bacterium]|nr:beta-L-arabinofuranosidase domain-containing protein [Bryobacteraceae bacterium]